MSKTDFIAKPRRDTHYIWYKTRPNKKFQKLPNDTEPSGVPARSAGTKRENIYVIHRLRRNIATFRFGTPSPVPETPIGNRGFHPAGSMKIQTQNPARDPVPWNTGLRGKCAAGPGGDTRSRQCPPLGSLSSSKDCGDAAPDGPRRPPPNRTGGAGSRRPKYKPHWVDPLQSRSPKPGTSPIQPSRGASPNTWPLRGKRHPRSRSDTLSNENCTRISRDRAPLKAERVASGLGPPAALHWQRHPGQEFAGHLALGEGLCVGIQTAGGWTEGRVDIHTALTHGLAGPGGASRTRPAAAAGKTIQR